MSNVGGCLFLEKGVRSVASASPIGKETATGFHKMTNIQNITQTMNDTLTCQHDTCGALCKLLDANAICRVDNVLQCSIEEDVCPDCV